MTIDILPTLASLTGCALPELPIDGKNIWPLLSAQPGAKSPQDAYYVYWGRELQAVRAGRWKLHLPHVYRTLDGQPGKDGSRGKNKDARTELALYDLQVDVGETTDVAEQHPDIVKHLEALAERARAELGDSATKTKGSGERSPSKNPASAMR
jgi:arylsulfatase A-like enzyme